MGSKEPSYEFSELFRNGVVDEEQHSSTVQVDGLPNFANPVAHTFTTCRKRSGCG